MSLLFWRCSESHDFLFFCSSGFKHISVVLLLGNISRSLVFLLSSTGIIFSLGFVIGHYGPYGKIVIIKSLVLPLWLNINTSKLPFDNHFMILYMLRILITLFSSHIMTFDVCNCLASFLGTVFCSIMICGFHPPKKSVFTVCIKNEI